MGAREEALLIEGDRVLHVGSERAVLKKANAAGARLLDLEGRRVIPGLIDSHTHLIHQGLLRGRVDLKGASSKGAALGRVRRAARLHKGQAPLMAERWDESTWPRSEWPTRDELDAISTRFPIVMRRVDGHIAVANTAALDAVEGRLAGVDRDRGLLVEDASLYLNRIWPTPVPTCEEALRTAQETALRLGVTTVHDFVVPNYLRAYQALHRAGHLRIRAHASLYVESLDALAATGLETGLGDGRLSVGGIKAFADGSIGGHTAALTRPYADEPGSRGRLNWSDEAMLRIAREAAGAGLTPSIHAIGDAAIDQVLTSYEALDGRKRRRLRPRIEHFEVHSPEHVRRARELGVSLSMQPNFVGTWCQKGGLYEFRFGDDRYRRNNEFRRILAAGAHLAFGSDCMPFDPWWGLEAAVRAPHASQRLSVEAALRAYTIGSAYALGRELDLGTLERRKLADLLVVDGAWGKPGGLAATRVRATMVGGVWAHGKPPRSRRF